MTDKNNLSASQKEEFHNWVFSVVVRNYKEGLLSEERTRWALTKEWNSEYAHIGIPDVVRETLGEEVATRLFQDEADNFRLTPEGIGYINEVRRYQQRAKDIEDMFNQKT